jgi:hypothetical protein
MRGPRRWCLTLLLGLGLVLCDETSSPLPRTELRIGCLKSHCTAAGAGGGSSTSGKVREGPPFALTTITVLCQLFRRSDPALEMLGRKSWTGFSLTESPRPISPHAQSFNPTFEGFLNRMGATMKPIRTFQLKLYDDEQGIIFSVS